MAEGFDALRKGSAILEWSPSGEMKRHLVVAKIGPPYMPDEVPPVYEVALMHDDGSVTIGNGTIISADWVERMEGFGSTIVCVEDGRKIPDFGTRTK